MTHTANHQTAAPVAKVPEGLHRANSIRDALAGVMLFLAALLPWNIHFGISIAGGTGWVLGVLILVTLMSLAGVALSHFGPFGIRAQGWNQAGLNRLRLVLTIPYLMLAAGFVIFTVVQSIRAGGSSVTPPGLGPGAWIGVAGALLAGAPVMTGTDNRDLQEAKACRIIGIVSLTLALASALFNLYWRTRFVMPNVGDADTGVQNSVVVVTALLYGIVALLPVIIATRWLMAMSAAARLATQMLAGAVVISSLFVWLLPVGRDLDAFHGIAQNTSTAGVGWEGYLAWVAAAAIIGPATVRAALDRNSVTLRRAATRHCLALIAAWCTGTAVLRILDLMTSSVLDLPDPPYNATALMAFDLVAAVVAMWLFINGSGKAAPRLLVALLCGILFVSTVCRVIVGVALVPRVRPLNPADITDVYGNTLAQQITSTFDVALCVLALILFIVALIAGTEALKKPALARADATRATRETVVPVDESEATAAVPTDKWARPGTTGGEQSPPTITMSAGAADAGPSTAKIFRPEPAGEERPAADRVAEVLAESTQRFAAGTTYGAGAQPQFEGTSATERQ